MSRAPGVEGLKAVADLAKQVITLGSTLLGVTVTFADKFQDKGRSGTSLSPPPELAWAWALYILSVLFAVMTLMAVAGSLNEIDRTQTERNPARSNTTIWGRPMLLCFVLGLTFTAVAGWSALN